MRVVVAVDFSSVAGEILDFVRRFPGRGAHRIFIIHVAEPDPDFAGWDAGPDVVREQVASDFQRHRRDVDGMAEQLRAAGIEATGLVVQGPTVSTILEEVQRRRADLLVIGSHGHGAAYDLVVGSVSSGAIRKASVPVLVIPHRRS